jgi:protoporphyrinogen oxidase
MENKQTKQVVIIGAGPAGLTAGYELTKYNIRPIVLEQDNKVGGLARTENYKGYYFDMGGHRFFTKSEPVNEMWHEVLGDEFLRRPRLSRIFYQDKFFFYPLKTLNALAGLGIWQTILIILSFIKWQVFPYKQEKTFEQWVTNRFGKRLFEIFFKTYTEKVWGIPCSELKAEWAAQRIKNLSLKTAMLSMFVKPGDSITTLIEEFHYPRFGPGMLWNEVKNQIESRDGKVHLNSSVIRIHRAGNCVDYVVVSQNGSGELAIHGTDFISSMPISEFIKKIEPVPPEVLEAANKLSYRDFLTVCLIVNKTDLFPDNWIYVHSPDVRVGRIQNFKNWSPDMVPDATKTSLGLEYFCTEGDDLWRMSDADLIELGKKELGRIGLANAGDVVDGCVFRVPKAYPIYDAEYGEYLQIVRDFVDSLENFQTIGRNGLHRYNNQDHSMITGTLAVRNLVFGEKNDLWSVNADSEYHEEIRQDGKKKTAETLRESITHIFPRLDPVALGFSLGITAGTLIFGATLFLIIKDGGTVGPHLGLLSNFVPGFSVTILGALLGLFGLGFIFGSIFAYLRNLAVFLSARVIHRDIELYRLKRLFDFI